MKKESCGRDKSKARIKKILIIIFAALLILLALYFGLKILLEKLISDKEQVKQADDYYMTSGFRNYYPEDYEADILSDKDYTSLDRNLMYTNQNGEKYNISDLGENTNEGQRFFTKYFDLLIGGRYKDYSSLFTDTYKESPDGFEKYTDRKFTSQRIYNINIKELARTDVSDASFKYEDKQCVFGFYEVSYKILKNDGTFRRDLPENGERPLILELVTFDAGTDKEETYIKNLYTVSSVTGSSDKEETDGEGEN